MKKGIVCLIGLEVVLMAICFGLFYAAPKKEPVVRMVKVSGPLDKEARQEIANLIRRSRVARKRDDGGLWPGLTNLFDYIDPRQAHDTGPYKIVVKIPTL